MATGSNRRRAQLQHLRPDLRFVELRGNIQRRVAQVGAPAVGGQITAIIAAGAGLLRQDMEDRISDWLPDLPDDPAGRPGRAGHRVPGRRRRHRRAAWRVIEHAPTRRQVDAERSFLVALGGDCDLPAGAHATLEDDDVIALRAVVASLDGTRVERTVVRGTDPAAVGPAAVAALPVTELLGPR